MNIINIDKNIPEDVHVVEVDNIKKSPSKIIILSFVAITVIAVIGILIFNGVIHV